MTRKQPKKTTYKKGLRAENIAALYLLLKGYWIVARRFKTKSGEIDLIARRGKTILIIEVKARKDLMSGHDAVDFMSQKRIMAAADIWLAQQKDAASLSLRFDVIIIRPWRLPTHIKNFASFN
ncbi:YraN family protein [Bartonella sp. HY038]|uniref:YraN family protein n=1 Tax=Bartonella sp. HY038 TaxID=2759660 RepID=UPI0015F7B27E|nr:YraN family protein [Bartonella sp. HY038]